MRIKAALKRLFKSPFGPLYDEARIPDALRRGLLFVMLGNLCGNIFATITTGSSLTGLAGILGANDFVFGVLTAIPSFGTLMQLPASIIVSKSGRRKKYMLTYGLAARALWILVGLVPYFVPMEPDWLRLWTVIFLVCVSSLGQSFINVSFTPWLADLVPIRIRGRWISCRDRIISVIGVGMGMLIAYLLDHIPGYPGYTIVFVLGGVLGVLDMVAFLGIQEGPPKPAKSIHFGAVLKQVVADKPFFRFLLFWTAWCFTANLAGPFINRYALGPMGLSFVEVTLAGQVAAAVITVLVISRWGRVIDRYGSKPTLWISCLLGSLTPLIMCLATPGNPISLLLYNVVGAAFWSASNLTATNMQMSYSPDEQRPTYIAIFSCVTSLAGTFLGVLLGGAILTALPGLFAATGFTVGGAAPDQYKAIFLLCVVTRLAAVLLILPRLDNDREATLQDLAADARTWLRDTGRQLRGRIRAIRIRRAIRRGNR